MCTVLSCILIPPNYLYRHTQPLFGFISRDPAKFLRVATHPDVFYVRDPELNYREVRSSSLYPLHGLHHQNAATAVDVHLVCNPMSGGFSGAPAQVTAEMCISQLTYALVSVGWVFPILHACLAICAHIICTGHSTPMGGTAIALTMLYRSGQLIATILYSH